MKTDFKINIEADLTKPIDDVTSKVIIPPTKEISSGITKLISVATTFIDNATYKYIENSKKKKEIFLENLEKEYNNIPKNDVQEPDILILGNSLESLKYCLDKEYLVKMYTNIIISDMDRRTKDDVHISYIDILKQLNYSDIKLLKAIYVNKSIKSMAFGKLNFVDSNNKFVGFEMHNSIYIADINNYIISDYNDFSKSVENLNRLGLIEISYVKYFNESFIYDNLIKRFEPYGIDILNKLKSEKNDVNFSCEKGLISISLSGFDLMKICLRDI